MEVTIDTLNEQYGLEKRILFEDKSDHFPIAHLHAPRATASIAAHGGHVLSYTPAGQQPVLWLSSFSHYKEGKAIRGGIPVIWPWFGSHQTDEAKPSHGFARTRFWKLYATRIIDGSFPQIRFQLSDSELTRALWPHSFELMLVVTLTDSLRVELIIENKGQTSFSCSCALHSYFNLSHISNIRIDGLDGVSYIDQLEEGPLKVQQGSILFESETDNIYVDTDATCRIKDAGFNRTIVVEKTGSQSTVVWNPWIAKAARMGDFGDDEYTGMVCIEAANAAHNTLTVSPSQKKTLSTTIYTEADQV